MTSLGRGRGAASSLTETLILWHQGPTLGPHLTILTSPEAPSPNTATPRVRVQHMTFGGMNSIHTHGCLSLTREQAATPFLVFPAGEWGGGHDFPSAFPQRPKATRLTV